MALNFPASPTDGQIYTDAATGSQYKYISSFGYWSAVAPTITGTIQYVIENVDGTALYTGIAGDLEIPYNCTITQWSLLGNATGNVVIDIWKSSYGNFPPVVANTVVPSTAKPRINYATKNNSSTLTGWSTTINSGDILRFNVDSCDAISRVTVSLRATKV